jgi:hypothetical protein
MRSLGSHAKVVYFSWRRNDWEVQPLIGIYKQSLNLRSLAYLGHARLTEKQRTENRTQKGINGVFLFPVLCFPAHVLIFHRLSHN